VDFEKDVLNDVLGLRRIPEPFHCKSIEASRIEFMKLCKATLIAGENCADKLAILPTTFGDPRIELLTGRKGQDRRGVAFAMMGF
jgi:hypothetical protein